ncbi:acyl-CoA dehydrogenase family protein [Bhargavaea beijingensis]|uniref:acyl-CoA dehydrogenase family protein n=1 Tax=Bhargavaea beijingensis TaxID=426756 RepID=UPI0022246897|nr:acyl-CoA dehydrogenase family protein [Bhargavaea beijingensis]MCW1927324.1 acyl-CoA dehydrogenase [Bhargavaea beijingensis]
MTEVKQERIDVARIRAHSEEMDRTRAVPQNLLDYLIEEKLFKLFVPEQLGGRMLGLPEALSVFRHVSHSDGNAGWLTTIGSGGGMFVPNMTEDTAHELFSPASAVIAGSGFPAGTAVPAEGGYRVSGEWKYCSGAPYASMFTANCTIEGTDTIRSMTLMPDQVEVLGDWNAFGLRATGSHSIRVTDAFVPENRTFSIFEPQNTLAGPVHSFPFVPFSVASFTSVCLGIADHFYEEARSLGEKKWPGADRQAFVLGELEQHEREHGKQAGSFETAVRNAWTRHLAGEEMTAEEEQHLIRTAKTAAGTARSGVQSAIRHFGMDAVMEQSPLNRIWRDLSTAAQHTFLLPEPAGS